MKEILEPILLVALSILAITLVAELVDLIEEIRADK
jgi:hypothetical protein